MRVRGCRRRVAAARVWQRLLTRTDSIATSSAARGRSYAAVFKRLAPTRTRLKESNRIAAAAGEELAVLRKEAKVAEALATSTAAAFADADAHRASVAADVRARRWLAPRVHCRSTDSSPPPPHTHTHATASRATQASASSGRIDRAESLVRAVGQDRARWTEAHHAAGATLTNALGDGVLQGAALTLLPPFDHASRVKLLEEWASCLDAAGVAHAPVGTLVDGLAAASAQRRWASRGLAMDGCSVMNAAVTLASRKEAPLLLDPQVSACAARARAGGAAAATCHLMSPLCPRRASQGLAGAWLRRLLKGDLKEIAATSPSLERTAAMVPSNATVLLFGLDASAPFDASVAALLRKTVRGGALFSRLTSLTRIFCVCVCVSSLGRVAHCRILHASWGRVYCTYV
jgi:hypothetical protein